MTKVFKFQEKKGLELNLNGVKFNLDVTDPLFASKTKKFSNTMLKLGKDYSNINDLDQIEAEIEVVMNTCVEAIDGLLGEGATKGIFGDNPINFVDLADLSGYIISEIANYSNSDMKSVIDKYSPQRLNQ